MDKHASFAKDISHVLLKNRVITDAQAASLAKLFKESGKEYFDDFILETGMVSKEDLLDALSQLYKAPAVDAEGYFFQAFVLHKFPKDVMHRYAFIPLEIDDDIMLVLASEPDDPRLLSTIGEFVSYDIRFCVGIRRDITDAISEFYDAAVTEVPEDIDLRNERHDERDLHHMDSEDDELPISDEDVLD